MLSGEAAGSSVALLTAAADASSNAASNSTGNPGVPSFTGSCLTWLNNVRDGTVNAQLAFLRSFLRDSGIPVDPDLSDLQALRDEVRSQMTKRPG